MWRGAFARVQVKGGGNKRSTEQGDRKEKCDGEVLEGLVSGGGRGVFIVHWGKN